MRSIRAHWFIGFFIVGSGCLLAQPTFFRKDIPVRGGPVFVVAADLNGDAQPDLVVFTEEGLWTSLNMGGGNFGQPVVRPGDLATGVRAAIADFNGDGNDDLVAGSDGLLLSRGDGVFLSPRPVGVGGEPLSAGDFNRDGKSDLLVTFNVNGARIALGNGDGTFQPGATFTAKDVAQAIVADFNRDGLSDVALLQAVAGPPEDPPPASVLVFLGRGDGRFGPEIRTPSVIPWVDPFAAIAARVLVADFNGDGLPDIATASQTMLGRGDGSFQPTSGHVSEVGEFPIAAADFTGDGYADLVTSSAGTNVVSIFPGDSNGILQAPLDQSVGWPVPIRFITPLGNLSTPVDFDGDGQLDLVTANWGSNSLSVLMPRAQAAPALRRAVSAADYSALVAPESLATLFAPVPAVPAGASASASPPWPNRLGGISLEVHDRAGVTHLAPLIFVSATQINFQVPASTALGEATLAIIRNGETTEIGSMEVDAVAPRLFMMSHSYATPAATGAWSPTVPKSRYQFSIAASHVTLSRFRCPPPAIGRFT